MAVKNRQLVKGFNHHREADSRVQIAFGNREAKTFGNQAKTDHQQEAQTENDDGRMAVNKAGQGFAGHQHQANGNHHCNHHDRQVVNHADGGDHRVEREDGIQHHDLRHNPPESRAFALGRIIAIFPFQPLVEFNGGFEEEEQAARQHYEIAGAKAQIAPGDEWFGQRDQPGD